MDEKEQNSASREASFDYALESFLSREPSTEKKKPKKRKTLIVIIICAAVAAALAALAIILSSLPKTDDDHTESVASVNVSADENGELQAEPEKDKDGNIAENGSGTLVSYSTSDVARIDIENSYGSYTITSYTPTVTNEDGEETTDTTEYTLVGYEDFELQDGTADSAASDAAELSFISIVSSGDKDLSDFGLASPEAVVKITFSDDIYYVIKIGADAPSSAGKYITFGEGKEVYLVDSEAVDSFMNSPMELISLTVSEASDDSSDALKSLTISGEHYDEPIVITSNTDEAINSDYLMTSPLKVFPDPTESSDIAGDIRGVYAEEVALLNPSEKQLKEYGLDSPYAKIKAEYDSETLTLLSSPPDSEGNIYLMLEGKQVVYKLQLASIEWANTSVEKLMPSAVLDLNKEAVSSIKIESPDTSLTIDVNTETSSRQNDSGEAEEVKVTTAVCNSKKITEENCSVFFQNLCGMQLLKAEKSSKSEAYVKITVSYSTSRADDVIEIGYADSSRLPVSLNGAALGEVYKSYVTKFLSSAEDLAAGKAVPNI